ncbi:MAG: hypothetical protein V7L05_11715 [Nostoc sp.]
MPNTSATLSTSAQSPMPNAQCPMPNAQCPIPIPHSFEFLYSALA